MEDVLITPRMIVQAMCDAEADPVDVEEVRQILRQERLVAVPQAVAAKKKHDVAIKVCCRILYVVLVAVVPFAIAKEIWPALWLTWLIVAITWSAIAFPMLALFFLLTRNDEEKHADIWTVEND